MTLDDIQTVRIKESSRSIKTVKESNQEWNPF